MTALALACAVLGLAAPLSAQSTATVAVPYSTYTLTDADQAFLEDLSSRAFLFFWEQADPQTGLVLDRARLDGTHPAGDHGRVASVAATGFSLSALCVAAQRGWVAPDAAKERARNTLRFIETKAPQVHGWFYHWMDFKSGARMWNSEVSSIDTALFLAGALTARRCFSDDKEIVRSATRIYERVDFSWLMDKKSLLLSMGYTPEKGFIPSRWDTYSEHMALDLMAIGSPTHPIPAKAWRAWKRDWMDYGGIHYLNPGTPLFTHQYSHAYVDFRNRRESAPPRVDYFANSILATRAHRAFCLDLAKQFPSYSEQVWGITASDGPNGYVAWGGPPRHPAIDGTVVPCAAAGSLMFTPELSLPALKAMKEKYGERLYRRYGFPDAFNPDTRWVGPDVLAIDQGITLLSAENLRTGAVWGWFMRNPEITGALRKVGLLKVEVQDGPVIGIGSQKP